MLISIILVKLLKVYQPKEFGKIRSLSGGMNLKLLNCFRSSHLEVLCKKSVAKSFSKFTGKYFFQTLFINKFVVLSLY